MEGGAWQSACHIGFREVQGSSGCWDHSLLHPIIHSITQALLRGLFSWEKSINNEGWISESRCSTAESNNVGVQSIHYYWRTLMMLQLSQRSLVLHEKFACFLGGWIQPGNKQKVCDVMSPFFIRIFHFWKLRRFTFSANGHWRIYFRETHTTIVNHNNNKLLLLFITFLLLSGSESKWLIWRQFHRSVKALADAVYV